MIDVIILNIIAMLGILYLINMKVDDEEEE